MINQTNVFISIFNLTNISYMENPPTIKKFNVTGVSIPNGIRITYPNADNKVHDIDNPLETFIASLAACITTMLRMFAKNKNFKLGQIAWTRIESSLDLSLLKSAGGPGNKINDILMDAEIETSLSE